MELHRLILLEHTGWALDKSLETDFGLVVSALGNGKIPSKDDLSEKGKTLFKHILSVAQHLVGSSRKVEIFGKPSGAKPTYGSGSEPKSDMNFQIGSKVYAASVKSGPAYAMSAGSKTEYLGIVAATVELFEQLYPDIAATTKAKIIEALEPVAKNIGVNVKDSDYSANKLKDKKDGWFKRNLEKHDWKDEEREEIQRLKDGAIEIIDRENRENQGKYKAMLKTIESETRACLLEAFSTEEFAKCFIWEIVTGVKKFNGLSEIGSFKNSNAAYANCVVYLDGSGVFDVSKIDSPYVLESVSGHSVRLQNVPRGWVGTYFKRVRGGGTPGARLLADSLREIEMSLKIGVGPVKKKGKKVQESALLEFKRDSSVGSALLSGIRACSLLDLIDVFGLAPKVTKT